MVRGTILGVVLSSLMRAFGITIEITLGMMMLIPFTMLLVSINPKWGCFAYVIPFTFVIGEVLKIFGHDFEIFQMPYEKFIIFIGFLHLVEGILVIRCGDELVRDIPVFHNNKIIRGQLLKKFWPVPLIIFVGNDGINPTFIPLYAILGYMDVVKYGTPKMKAQSMGSVIMVYGMAIIFLGELVYGGFVPVFIGLLLMPIGHEFMFLINYIPEKKPVVKSVKKASIEI
ncbi:MAG: hypothetical protein ATN36_00730 [Epulopiscium sp. Nele67-Bin005]|nr:MAG: hypothetical protein ATN36_00730 [Epulopiscium sp. Nele67-Bin005]